MKRMKAFLLLIVITIFFSSCQPTPEEKAIQGKTGNALPSNTAPSEQGKTNDTFTYEKEYANGNRLIVDAPIRNYLPEGAAILSVEQQELESSGWAKEFVQQLYPNETVCDSMGALTKQELETLILYYQNEIYKIEAGLPLIEGDDSSIVPENRKASEKNTMNKTIEYYEGLYATAPDEEYKPATYTFRQTEDSGRQSNMFIMDGEEKISLDFVDWGEGIGSLFKVQTPKATVAPPLDFPKAYMLEELTGDEKFSSVKNVGDDVAKKLGIDYMQLNLIETDGTVYDLYYVRAYNGLEETHITMHRGASVMQTDDSKVMNLWEPEYLWVRIYNNEAIQITWNNISKLKQIDEENVAVLSWEEIQSIFEKQMDYFITASNFSQHYADQKVDIEIYRIEFGLTKVLTKNSKSDYKLVPSWSFIGKDVFQQTKDEIPEICYLTLNAVDGTVIDRGMMY